MKRRNNEKKNQCFFLRNKEPGNAMKKKRNEKFARIGLKKIDKEKTNKNQIRNWYELLGLRKRLCFFLFKNTTLYSSLLLRHIHIWRRVE